MFSVDGSPLSSVYDLVYFDRCLSWEFSGCAPLLKDFVPSNLIPTIAFETELNC